MHNGRGILAPFVGRKAVNFLYWPMLLKKVTAEKL
jgi:hypothetical protein